MIVIIHTTTATIDEAKKIAHVLLVNHLAACVNIRPICSIYRWENNIEEDEEYDISIKSDIRHLQTIKSTIISMHSYELPAFIWWNAKAETKYEKWIKNVTNNLD